jgi:hypothetical protein
MIMVISFAAYQATRDMMDLWALLAFGTLGVLMRRFGWSRPALLIGFVLAPQAEAYLNQAVQFYGWSMLARPGVVVLIVLIAVSLYFSRRGRIDENGPTVAETTDTDEIPWPQLAFVLLAMLLFIYAIFDGARQSFLGGIFPIGIAVAILPFMIYIVVAFLTAGPAHAARYDAERSTQTARYRYGWLLALAVPASLYVLTAILGLIPAVVVFFIVFLRFWAKLGWLSIVLMTIAAAAMLVGFGSLLTLDYPAGLLEMDSWYR